MKILPVHCCCDASKRLGYLPVPNDAREAVAFKTDDDSIITLQVGVVSTPTHRVEALKSMNLPVEILRTIRGWREETHRSTGT